ncbi:MAG: hypothetical protein IPL83_07720 [Bdellovibrionales bacterium]|nr:hypothetical protein [Bdellovibrionales bacterium]
MANIDDVLDKNRVRIDRINQPKKIKRTGATRPWQIGQMERQSGASSEEDALEQLRPILKNSLSDKLSPTKPDDVTPDKSEINSSRDKISNWSLEASGRAMGNDTTPPGSDTHFLKPGQLEKNTDTVPTQIKTIPTQIFETNSEITNPFSIEYGNTIPTQKNKDNRHSTDTKTDLVPTQNKRGDTELDSINIDLNVFTEEDTNTIPTHKNKSSRHITDTNSNQLSAQYRHKSQTGESHSNIPSDKSKPQYNRHTTNTLPTHTGFNLQAKQTQLRHTIDTTPTPHPTQSRHTIVNNTDTIDRDLLALRGHRLKVFHFCYEMTLKSNFQGFRTTYDSIAINIQIPLGSVRTTTKRLKSSGFIELQPIGKGRGALVQILVPDLVSKLYSKRLTTDTVPTHLANKYRHNANTTTDTTGSSSSSDINNKNITNTIGPESKRQDLPEDWLQIQTPENVKAIGFGQTQIKQLFQLGTLSASEVQESLEAFAYDLEVGGISSRGSKLAFLMGILRRSGAYISEGLVSELKVQVENNEKRRREMADLEKRQAQDKLTAKAQEIASHMTEREKLSLVPENGLVKIGSVSHERLVMAKIVEGLSKS